MLPEKAKDCRREEGGHAGDPLSFFPKSKINHHYNIEKNTKF